MKAKALKYFRKHWEYRFLSNGGVMCRNKNSGNCEMYASILELVSWYAISDKFGVETWFSWADKKRKIMNKRKFDSLPKLSA